MNPATVAITPREAIQRLYLCKEAVRYFGEERLIALAQGDQQRERAARQEQTVMLGMAAAWKARLRAGRTAPMTVVV